MIQLKRISVRREAKQKSGNDARFRAPLPHHLTCGSAADAMLEANDGLIRHVDRRSETPKHEAERPSLSSPGGANPKPPQ